MSHAFPSPVGSVLQRVAPSERAAPHAEGSPVSVGLALRSSVAVGPFRLSFHAPQGRYPNRTHGELRGSITTPGVQHTGGDSQPAQAWDCGEERNGLRESQCVNRALASSLQQGRSERPAHRADLRWHFLVFTMLRDRLVVFGK